MYLRNDEEILNIIISFENYLATHNPLEAKQNNSRQGGLLTFKKLSLLKTVNIVLKEYIFRDTKSNLLSQI